MSKIGKHMKLYIYGFLCSAVPGAGVCTEQPQEAATFSAITGLSIPAIPLPQWSPPCNQPSPQAAHTVLTEQADVQNLSVPSDQLVTETKGLCKWYIIIGKKIINCNGYYYRYSSSNHF